MCKEAYHYASKMFKRAEVGLKADSARLRALLFSLFNPSIRPAFLYRGKSRKTLAFAELTMHSIVSITGSEKKI